jgi:hypothetical protein
MAALQRAATKSSCTFWRRREVPSNRAPSGRCATLFENESGLFTSGASRPGQFTADTLAERAAAAGFRWVALQAGEHSFDDAKALDTAWPRLRRVGCRSDRRCTAPTATSSRSRLPTSTRLRSSRRIGGIAPFVVVTTFGGADTPELVGAARRQKYAGRRSSSATLQDDPDPR